MLNGMIEEVIVPGTVHAECTLDLPLPGAQAVRDATEAGLIQLRPDAARHEDDPNEEPAALGAGELAAIRVALALQCPVLMDERLGRQAARRRGSTVIGSAGLLLGVRQRGLVPAVAPILDQWRQSGYFLSEAVIKAVLERAGEA